MRDLFRQVMELDNPTEDQVKDVVRPFVRSALHSGHPDNESR